MKCKQLKRLTRAVNTMGAMRLIYGRRGKTHQKANKAEIAAAAKRRWKQVGKNVNWMEQRVICKTCLWFMPSRKEDEVKP